MIVEIKYPMPGILKGIHVKEGEKVQAGQYLATLESMKMFNNIESPSSGKIKKINFNINDFVKPDLAIMEIET